MRAQEYSKTWMNLKMPAEVTPQVIHYFWPDESFRRELPKYPPTHFLDKPYEPAPLF
jgi:hypothetical protein